MSGQQLFPFTEELFVEEVPIEYGADEVGQIYKVTNLIQYDPDHPLYAELEPHDMGGYAGKTSTTHSERYRGDIVKNTHNKHLKKAFKKFGRENFDIAVIEDNIPLGQLGQREDFWMKQCNCIYPNGYNINKASKKQWRAITWGKTVLLRNIKTNKVFEINNLWKFCKNPGAADPDWDGTKINYQQLSNVTTGYIGPREIARGQTKYPEKVTAQGYCLATNTLEDLENIRKYKVRVRKENSITNLSKTKLNNIVKKLPVTIVSLKTLGQFTLSTIEELATFCVDNQIDNSTLSRLFSRKKPCGSFILKNNITPETFNSMEFWKYDNKGEPFSITIVNDKKQRKTFLTTEIGKISDKLAAGDYHGRKGAKSASSDCYRRSLSRLISGELPFRAYGWQLAPRQEINPRLAMVRFFNNKYVRGCIREGYLKRGSFNLIPILK